MPLYSIEQNLSTFIDRFPMKIDCMKNGDEQLRNARLGLSKRKKQDGGWSENNGQKNDLDFE